MKHSSTTSLISSLMFASLIPTMPDERVEAIAPREETICALQMLARTYKPGQMDGIAKDTRSENRWLNEHTFTSEAI